MLTIRVAMTSKPGAPPAVVDHLRVEQREVPECFDGCAHYAVWVDPADDRRALLYEEWVDHDAFATYRSSERFERNRAVLIPLLDGEPDSAYYNSQLVGP